MPQPNPSPAADAHSASAGTDQPPPELPEAAPAFCSTCGAALRSNAHFCSDCGTARAPSADDEAAAIHSQLGGSSADLAELMSARGHVVACPSCDELNNASAAWCRHCGQRLPAPDPSQPATPTEDVPHTSGTHDERKQARSSPAARPATQAARRYGPGIALVTQLALTTAAVWLAWSPPRPASVATDGATSGGSPIVQPAEPLAIIAADPVAASPIAPSPVPAATIEEPEKASPPAPPPVAAQKPAPAPERAPPHKKVTETVVLRTSAPIAIDELYRHRAAERCTQGLHGLICRQKLRYELCNGKWTQDARPGMGICRLNG